MWSVATLAVIYGNGVGYSHAQARGNIDMTAKTHFGSAFTHQVSCTAKVRHVAIRTVTGHIGLMAGSGSQSRSVHLMAAGAQLRPFFPQYSRLLSLVGAVTPEAVIDSGVNHPG